MAAPTFSTRFALTVRKHRLAKGLSQEALADAAAIHRTHVGLLERGERGASIDVAERIARALGVALSKLVAETEEEPRRIPGAARRR